MKPKLEVVPLGCYLILTFKGKRKKARGPNPASFLFITGKVDFCRRSLLYLYKKARLKTSRIKTSETRKWKVETPLSREFFVKGYKEMVSLGFQLIRTWNNVRKSDRGPNPVLLNFRDGQFCFYIEKRESGIKTSEA